MKPDQFTKCNTQTENLNQVQTAYIFYVLMKLLVFNEFPRYANVVNSITLRNFLKFRNF